MQLWLWLWLPQVCGCKMRRYCNSHTKKTKTYKPSVFWLRCGPRMYIFEFTCLSSQRDTHPPLALSFPLAFIPLFGSSQMSPKPPTNERFNSETNRSQWIICHHAIWPGRLTSLPALSFCHLPQLGLLINPRLPSLPRGLFPITAAGSNFSICEHS